MTNKFPIRLYTQDNCPFCIVMIEKLSSWGINFDVINITSSPQHKPYLKEQGVRTVPQLFIEDFNINKDINTNEFTEIMFYDRLDIFIEETDKEKLSDIIEKYELP